MDRAQDSWAARSGGGRVESLSWRVAILMSVAEVRTLLMWEGALDSILILSSSSDSLSGLVSVARLEGLVAVYCFDGSLYLFANWEKSTEYGMLDWDEDGLETYLLFDSWNVSGNLAGAADSSLKNLESRILDSSRKLADGRTDDSCLFLLEFSNLSWPLEDLEAADFDVLLLEDLELGFLDLEDEGFFLSSPSEESCLREENMENNRDGFEDEYLDLNILSFSLSFSIRDDNDCAIL